MIPVRKKALVKKIITLIENLSLHVVAGSICSALFAAKVLEAELPLWWITSLGLAVWSVYTLDHLFDAGFNRKIIHNQRHRFHAKHFQRLMLLLILTGIAVILLFYHFATVTMWKTGGLLAILTLMHIVLVSSKRFSNRKWLQKEVQIALIYSVGIWFGPVVFSHKGVDLHTFVIFISFALLAWWETSFIALEERESDLMQHNSSIATRLGAQKTKSLLKITLFLQLGLSVILYLTSDGITAQFSLLLLLMGIAFLLLFLYQKKFSTEGVLHLAGELVFCIPVLIFLF